MTQLNLRIDQFSTWSDVRTNIKKCRITAFLHPLQKLPKKARDEALQARLSPLTLQGHPIPILAQDEPLPGGYLGTRITAALARTPHLTWAQDNCHQAINSLRSLPT